MFVYLLFPLPFVEDRGGVLVTLANEIEINQAQSITSLLLNVFISFIEFPTCEPLTQFICKSGRCISSKWHCDSGKYQMFPVLHSFDWGPGCRCCFTSFRRSLYENFAEPSKMAKTSGEMAPGTSVGISIKENGTRYLSLGAIKRFLFRYYAGHSLSLQTWSKGENWGNDLDDSGSPKHRCKVLCHLRMEEFINYYGIIRMVSTLSPCSLCTNNVCFLYLIISLC